MNFSIVVEQANINYPLNLNSNLFCPHQLLVSTKAAVFVYP